MDSEARRGLGYAGVNKVLRRLIRILDPDSYALAHGFLCLIPICIQDGDRGGSEEPTQAYYKYVEESDVATTKVYV
jgi:hypothetical protein